MNGSAAAPASASRTPGTEPLPNAAKAARPRAAPSAAFPSMVEKAPYLDTMLWLPPNLLLRGDRMTMAHSLELRCPFLMLAR